MPRRVHQGHALQMAHSQQQKGQVHRRGKQRHIHRSFCRAIGLILGHYNAEVNWAYPRAHPCRRVHGYLSQLQHCDRWRQDNHPAEHL
jgi:hypothetical protein